MSLEITQTVVTDDGRYAQVTFKSASNGRIRILRILVSDTDDENDESAWARVHVDNFERDELKYMIGQLDLSELELEF